MSEIKYRLATLDDYNEIVNHSKGGPDSAPALNAFKDLLKTDSFYLIICDEEIAGSFSFVRIRSDTLLLQFLRVKKEFRMKGIGRKTIQYIENLSKEKGCDCLLSTVLKINTGSIEFHKKTGFKESGNIDFENPELIFMKDI